MWHFEKREITNNKSWELGNAQRTKGKKWTNSLQIKNLMKKESVNNDRNFIQFGHKTMKKK